ncbi:MAG: exodeoxyribonuclease VII large subunit [Parachlamydiales bacterium]|nr:exodeoxyribonuclease VII large subunit [Parachlamydiales bacterium]
MTSFPTLEIPVLTVSQLTSSIKQLLETKFQSLLLQGEISNFKHQSSGHLYFSLKDERAQISCVMFRMNAQNIRPIPKEGDQVIVKGEISVYEPRGNYQLIVRELYYVGVGALLLKLEQLKQKLSAMGFFAQEHKKPLPKNPKKIGVITSPSGAVIQDILNVLTRRHSGFHLILNPVKVQGDGAAKEIAQAIEQFNQFNLVDVMIVGRGGGSIEDLFAFNEEVVAHAIYKSRIPVISAVGHETDFSISDLVADVRAPTPSAAAEIVIGEKAQQLDFLNNAKKRINHALSHLIRHHKIRIQSITRHPYFATPYTFLGKYIQQIDDFKTQLQQVIQNDFAKKRLYLSALSRQMQSQNPLIQLQQMRLRLKRIEKNIDALMLNKLKVKKDRFSTLSFKQILDNRYKQLLNAKSQRLGYLVDHLRAIDPKALLNKGYSILFSEKDGSLIISTSNLQPNETLRAHLSDGEARLQVKEVLKSEKN